METSSFLFIFVPEKTYEGGQRGYTVTSGLTATSVIGDKPASGYIGTTLRFAALGLM